MSLMKRAKTLFHSLLGIALLAGSPALAAGTTPLALVPQVDSAGNVASGCLLYFFVAGTVATPQNAYADFGLTQPLPNPVQCDQSGRVPMHWLADGLIHLRLTDATGLQILDTTMQVLGPSSGGGGGGGTIDPTTIAQTGDLKARYDTGLISGWVRSNGLTIGNATSGATERANADTQNLFIYLYNKDPNLVVSGGRTGNALNDYNANKTIATPDWRGRALAFMDDMGNTPAGRLTSTYFGTSAIVLGAAGGNESNSVILMHNHGITDPGHLHTTSPAGMISANTAPIGVVVGINPSPSGNFVMNSSVSQTGISINNAGSASAHNIVMPAKLASIYLKL